MAETSNMFPKGTVTLPIFPTEKMTRAGIMALNSNGHFHQAVQVIAVYQAMIAAAENHGRSENG